MLSNVDKILLQLYGTVGACNVKFSHNTHIRRCKQTECAVKTWQTPDTTAVCGISALSTLNN